MTKKVLILNGGMRANGNSGILAAEFAKGCENAGSETENVIVKDLNIRYCTGCLRCNIAKRCSIQNDDFSEIAEKIFGSDIIVFATPVYFHHFTGPMKKLTDRFRSFINVKITETGIVHTPWRKWNKKIVLITSMGSPDNTESKPIRDLMNFMCEIMGEKNELITIEGTRLAIAGQILKPINELETLYSKMGIPVSLANTDYLKNRDLLKRCFEEGYNAARD